MEGVSEVWKYFERGTGCNKGKARCNKCKKVFEHDVTSTLRYHASSLHSIVIKKQVKGAEKEKENQKVDGTGKRQTTIESAFGPKEKEPTGLVLSRLAACDRIPFSTIANSQYILKGLVALGLKVPKSRNGIINSIFSYADEMRKSLSKDIAQRLTNNERFSISFDEYTSMANKRYMCLNLHSQKHEIFSLGMIAVVGSLPAEEAIKLLDTRLASFGLDRKRHIVGAVTDGAAMMKKLVKMMEIEHQLCHSHGSHLAVCDLIYKAPRNTKSPAESDGGGSGGDGGNGANGSRNKDMNYPVEDGNLLVETV